MLLLVQFIGVVKDSYDAGSESALWPVLLWVNPYSFVSEEKPLFFADGRAYIFPSAILRCHLVYVGSFKAWKTLEAFAKFARWRRTFAEDLSQSPI